MYWMCCCILQDLAKMEVYIYETGQSEKLDRKRNSDGRLRARMRRMRMSARIRDDLTVLRLHIQPAQQPMEVRELRSYNPRSGTAYSICPRCGQAVAREYIRFCELCGQKLSWKEFSKGHVVLCQKIPSYPRSRKTAPDPWSPNRPPGRARTAAPLYTRSAKNPPLVFAESPSTPLRSDPGGDPAAHDISMQN